jgi:hypothetical protein
VFGPKVLATRFPFTDRALESRCLTKLMTPSSRRPDIPINLPDNSYDEVDRLQKKLLLFRLRNYLRVGLNPAVYDPNLEDRYNQILIPLLSIISDEAVKNQIKSLVLELQEKAVEDRAESLEGKVLKALVTELRNSTEASLLVKTVTKQARVLVENEKLTPKKVGAVLRSMGFQTKQDPSSKLYHVEVSQERLERLKKRYGIRGDENVD